MWRPGHRDENRDDDIDQPGRMGTQEDKQIERINI